MQQRRIGFWIYWFFVIGMVGCIGRAAAAGDDVSAQPTQALGAESRQLATSVPEGSPIAVAKVEVGHMEAPQPAKPVVVYEQVGVASWYGHWHQGHPTASGQPFDEHKLTAAHRSLPLDTKARITNLENGRSVEVTVNDRGPYIRGRVLDLSTRAAQELGMTKDGLALVRIEVQSDETEGSTVD